MLAALGEAIIDLVVGILMLILRFLLTIVAFMLDTIIYTFSFMLDETFMSKVYGAIPWLNEVDKAITLMGIAVAIILLLVMIVNMGIAPILSAGKNIPYPSLIVFRTLTVIPFVICAEKISILLSNLFASFYSMMYSVYSEELDTNFYLTSALSSFLSDGTSFTTPSTDSLVDSLGLSSAIMATISEAVGVILTLLLVILVGWNMIQLFLEMFERFATMFFLMKISPLTIATAIYPASEKVAKSWVSFFIGQFSLWVLQIMAMGWVVNCLGQPANFINAFSADYGNITGLLCWAGMSYGFINMSRHIDDYINKLGLTAAITGSDFFRDVASLSHAISTGRNAIKDAGNVAKGAAGFVAGAGKATAGAAKFTARTGSRIIHGAVERGNPLSGLAAGAAGAVSDAAGAASNIANSNAGKALPGVIGMTAGAVAGVATANPFIGAAVATGASAVSSAVGGVVGKAVNKVGDVAKKAEIKSTIPHSQSKGHGEVKSDVKDIKFSKGQDGTEKFTASVEGKNKDGVITSSNVVKGDVGKTSTGAAKAVNTQDYSVYSYGGMSKDGNAASFTWKGQDYTTRYDPETQKYSTYCGDKRVDGFNEGESYKDSDGKSHTVTHTGESKDGATAARYAALRLREKEKNQGNS